jgi:hypothetical protein
MHKALVPCSILLLSGVLCAQGYVSPSHHRNAEGLSNNVFPFGSSIPFRYAQVHDDVPPMPILRMSFRHNGTSSGTAYVAHSVTVDAFMSTAVTTAATMSTTFDSNHGANKVQVITNRTYNHPASNPVNLPGDWVLDYPLDTPFAFPGSGSLCWEAQVTSRVPTNSITHDAIGGSANPPLQAQRALTGCISTGRTAAISATGGSTMNWPSGTGTLTVTGSQLVANGAIVNVLGFDRTNFGAVPLPFLLPGSDTAPSGACYLYTDLWVVGAGAATASGTSTYSLPVPATNDLHGLVTFSQIFGLDAPANPLGITSSNLVIHQFVSPIPSPLSTTRVWLSGSLGATGSRGLNSGLVTFFR